MNILQQTTAWLLIAGILAGSSARADDFSGFPETRPAPFKSGVDALNNSNDPDFLPVDEAFSVELHTQPGGYVLEWTIAPDYYLYRRMFKIKQQDGKDITTQTEFSRGLHKKDGYFGQVEVYYHSASASLGKDALRIDKQNSGKPGVDTLIVSYQGCAESGLCYPTRTRVLPLP